ncbi:hypothetical protein LNP74_05155 [Klebsiella pneumoniae subsp. pneumoniae]|nr:hypothetical protein [Klebsiella pneumoniae subsp. pneumoniae]
MRWRLRQAQRPVIIDLPPPRVAFSLREARGGYGPPTGFHHARAREYARDKSRDRRRLPKQCAEPLWLRRRNQTVALALAGVEGFISGVARRCLQGSTWTSCLAGALIIEQRQRRLRLRSPWPRVPELAALAAWWVISLPSLSVAC